MAVNKDFKNCKTNRSELDDLQNAVFNPLMPVAKLAQSYENQ